ncbi:hypothetical protein Bca52824_054555 [Brassica carinata]|uniref:DUF1985 domain-containing protein n=1 Tax=Brassica carinata TaxID=52824 RepID=A0A8X7UKL4_BRACI|nr:hypothetical protein Bca52824_054555 [Brassica carinata]
MDTLMASRLAVSASVMQCELLKLIGCLLTDRSYGLRNEFWFTLGPIHYVSLDEFEALQRMQKYDEVKRLRLLWLTCLPLLFPGCSSRPLHRDSDEEQLLLVDQNEDRQVTSLVQKLLCGETSKPEDFRGGDQSFSPKFKVPYATQGEGVCPTPVRQINLRPRNTTPIEIEDISSSGNSGEENRQCSERCTHENLKHWISQRFERMENNIEELRTLICKSLGLPEGSKHNARKRKAMGDPQVRRTPSPDDSIVGETEGRNRKGKKRKTVGTWHVGKKTLPRRRSGGGKEEVSRKNPPSSERESGHQNDDDHAKENESDNARFPPSDRNKGDQQQETQSNALVLFGDVLDVEPESYVLPAEHAVTSPGAWQKRNPTYRYEQGSPVAWDKTKRTVTVRLVIAPSSFMGWKPSSKSKNDGEGLEQVSAPMGFVEALVKEINSEIPGADEGNEGGEVHSQRKQVRGCRMTPAARLTFVGDVHFIIGVHIHILFWVYTVDIGNKGNEGGEGAQPKKTSPWLPHDTSGEIDFRY